jgi:selenide,water dikinase
LQEILHQLPLNLANPDLLVGTQTSDDAAVYRLNDSQALVLTTDFFMPIVDNPVDFGRIAATNALSDVYAMGGTPILALTVLGMPIDKLPVEAIQDIMRGGTEVCRDAGIPLAGGHSIDSPEPIFGLVAAGVVHPRHLRQNSTAQAGDRLILTKPLGIGVMTTALKGGKLSAEAYADVLGVMIQLNRIGATLAANPYLHAMTDVTGFGLLGHLLEVCRGSGLKAIVDWTQVPILPTAKTLAAQGVFPGAAQRNWDSYGFQVSFAPSAAALQPWERLLLTDPQTSGGLLLTVAPEGVESVMEQVKAAGHGWAAVVGECVAGEIGVEVGA